MRKRPAAIGERFGLLTVTASGRVLNGRSVAHVRCDCGTSTTVSCRDLRAGTMSCGCMIGRARSHGHSANGVVTREYTTWRAMISRCSNPNNPSFSAYGGRGVRVCDRWLNVDGFANFVADMGPKPLGRSIERTNVDLGYSPENCRWATATEQTRNRRITVTLTVGDETKSLGEWAAQTGVSYGCMYQRYKKGLSPSDVIDPRVTTPREAGSLSRRKGTDRHAL